MWLRGASRRWGCFALACLMTVITPLSSYAESALATGSDVGADADADAGTDVNVDFDAQIQDMLDKFSAPLEGESVPVLPDPDETFIDGFVSENGITPYEQSFLDHPDTFLDYPDTLIRPRSIAVIGAAVITVLCIIYSAAGFYIARTDANWAEGGSGWEITQGWEKYMRQNYDETDPFWRVWDALFGIEFRDGEKITFVGPSTLYNKFKEYCNAKVEGYGTDAPSYNVLYGDGAILFDVDTPISFTRYDGSVFSFTVPSGVFLLPVAGNNAINLFSSKVSYGVCIYLVSAKPFTFFCNDKMLSSSFSHLFAGNGSAYYYTINSISSSSPVSDLIARFFSGFSYPWIDFGYNPVTSDGLSVAITPEKSYSDLQRENYGHVSDEIVITPEAYDSLDEKLMAATDAAGVFHALEGTWDLGDTSAGEDTDDKVYPWVPDITSWLEKLLHGIESIPGQVTDALTGFGEKVEALPGSVAQALENTLIGEDDGTYQISAVVTQKFPFCVPFDLVGCFRVLQAPAVPPVWRVPFVVDSSFIHIHEEIVIDLSDWERPAAVIRFFVLLIFIFGLAYVTRYVVKG